MLSQRDEAISVIPPPPGITPNFVDPQSRAHVVIVVIIVCANTSALLTGLRFYTALSIIRHVRIDDYTKYGVGRHIWDIPFSTLYPSFMKFGVIGGTFHGFSIMLTKLSILINFVRFAPRGKLRIAMRIIMVIVVLYTLVASFDWLYICRPIEKYWDLTVTGGTCINWLKVLIFSCVMNTTTDAVILILPVLVLRNVQLPKKQKIGVTIVLMTGGLYVTIEVHLAIVCACLPALKPFLRKHMPRIIGK
ncbi:hypothetical protein K469DRAFT_665468 [Zopfia rhizophila CBS 207.26]|uniref:Rhodopsin domain-containing protein n=1 Tax=Zopfia rhizophila CBS 207.26 TaxID=1314779 RepID=A0A6A6DZX6_9PEZI|nr:hypothetical protein K469DRAFT_665468 [Zopfia rhizophila CBS 207.26]